MFATVTDARAHLDDLGITEHADRLLPLVRPCLRLFAAEADRVGGTRTGGLPDLPAGIAWPLRSVPIDADEIVRLGGDNHSAWLESHVRKALPYPFVAQIDLGEIAQVRKGGGPSQISSTGLPTDGRLLFFYDYALGPWFDGVGAARVIWDRSPVSELAPRLVPAELVELHNSERAEHDRMVADPMSLVRGQPPGVVAIIESSLQLGQTLEDYYREMATSMEFTSRYIFPAKPLAVASGLCWPSPSSIEAQADPAFSAVVADEIIESFFELSRPEGNRQGVRHILDGIPVPDQDDPRYTAAMLADADLSAMSKGDWPAAWQIARTRAGDWQLLLQVDMAGLLGGDLVEGIVCFLIQKDDLARRDFDRVQAIYQQT